MKNAPDQSRERRVPPLTHFSRITPETKRLAIKALMEFERKRKSSTNGEVTQ